MAIPNATLQNIMLGSFNLQTDTIKAVLVTAALSFNPDTHNFYSDISANEIAGTGGYTTGGKALANKAVTANNATDTGVWDADDVIWTAATITARGVVFIKDTGAAGTSRIIRYVDFGADKTSSGGDFTLQFAAAGIINTVAV